MSDGVYGRARPGQRAVLALVLGLAASTAWAQQTLPAPAAGGITARGIGGAPPGGSLGALGTGSVEMRVERLERMLSEQSLSDLVLRLQQLQQEVQELRGLVEVQQYQLRQLSGGRFGTAPVFPAGPGSDSAATGDAADTGEPAAGEDGTSPGGSPEQGKPDAAGDEDSGAAVPQPPPRQGVGAMGRGSGSDGLLALPSPETLEGGEREAYRAAFDLLKDRKYPEAKQEFTAMLAHYPQGQFADNGLYWLGEIGYVTKDYPAAMNHFNRLIADYPTSPKVPSAMLKLGYVYYEQQDLEQARRILTDVVKRYPDTTEGRLAKGRLEQITREGG